MAEFPDRGATTAHVAPDEGVIIRRIVTPEGVARRNGAGAEEA